MSPGATFGSAAAPPMYYESYKCSKGAAGPSFKCKANYGAFGGKKSYGAGLSWGKSKSKKKSLSFGTQSRFSSMKRSVQRRIGSANAARVSRGSKKDEWGGLSIKTPTRNSSEHITITIVMYFTVAGGVPSEADVLLAIDDMESLYGSCGVNGHLAEEKFDFMKEELTVKDCNDITSKLVTQSPYQPASVAVENFDQFPQ